MHQDSAVSWSPQPFRQAANDSRRDTFVGGHQGVFENSIASTASPRRDTFVVPTSAAHEETKIIRRETFVTSTKSMITSTPIVSCETPMDGVRRETFVFPSTVKKRDSTTSPSGHAKKSIEPLLQKDCSKPEIIEEEDEDAVDEKTITSKKDESTKVCNSFKDASMEVNFTTEDVPTKKEYQAEDEPTKPTTDINRLLEISDVDLSLSPEKNEISGLEVITNQSISLPPKSSSNVKLSLSNGKDASSEGFSKDDEVVGIHGSPGTSNLSDALKHSLILKQNSTVQLPISTDKEISDAKDDVANLNDFSRSSEIKDHENSMSERKNHIDNFDKVSHSEALNNFMDISEVDLCLSPAKKNDVSTGTYTKEDVANLADFKKTLVVPTIVESLVDENGAVSSIAVSNGAAHNVSTETYIKSPMNTVEDFHTDDQDLDHSHVSTATYVKSPKVDMVTAMAIDDTTEKDPPHGAQFDNVYLNSETCLMPRKLSAITEEGSDISSGSDSKRRLLERKDIDASKVSEAIVEEEEVISVSTATLTKESTTVVLKTIEIETVTENIVVTQNIAEEEEQHIIEPSKASSPKAVASTFIKASPSKEEHFLPSPEGKQIVGKIKAEEQEQHIIEPSKASSPKAVASTFIKSSPSKEEHFLPSPEGKQIVGKIKAPILLNISPIRQPSTERGKDDAVNVPVPNKPKTITARRSMDVFTKPTKPSNIRRSIAPSTRFDNWKASSETSKKTSVKPSTVAKDKSTDSKPSSVLNLSPIKAKDGAKLVNMTKNIPCNSKSVVNSTFNKPMPENAKPEPNDKPKPIKRRSMAAPSSRLTLIKPSSKNQIVSHPNPFAARNMYYDERWMEKQENGFKKWLNFVLTPPEDFETPGKLDVAKLWNACSKDVKVPRAPTREVLSVRAYTTRRELNTLRRNACMLWQSPGKYALHNLFLCRYVLFLFKFNFVFVTGMVQVITKIETEIEMHRILLRNDRAIHK